MPIQVDALGCGRPLHAPTEMAIGNTVTCFAGTEMTLDNERDTNPVLNEAAQNLSRLRPAGMAGAAAKARPYRRELRAMSTALAVLKIGFIGAGRVAQTLAPAFDRATWMSRFYNRGPDRRGCWDRGPSARLMPHAQEVVDICDLVLLTVSDDAILPVCRDCAGSRVTASSIAAERPNWRRWIMRNPQAL